ncbi:MAG: hypothetical protein H3Z52_11285 [archaeon]|nr:hypothetical protein [archaeon]
MVSEISLGIRLVIIFPTIFFIISYLLRLITTGGLEDEIENLAKGSSSAVRDVITEHFSWNYLIDAIILNLLNGLIIIFELHQSELGIILMFIGMGISLFSMIALAYGGEGFAFFTFSLFFGLYSAEFAYFILLTLDFWSIIIYIIVGLVLAIIMFIIFGKW